MLKDDPYDDFSLPDVDHATFDIVMYWLYTGRFWAPENQGSKNGGIPVSFRQVLSVYFFATKYSMQELQNKVLSLLYQLAVGDLTLLGLHAKDIYQSTTPSSPLRRLLIDLLVDVWHFSDSDLEGILPEKLLLDVLQRLQKSKQLLAGGVRAKDWVN